VINPDDGAEPKKKNISKTYLNGNVRHAIIYCQKTNGFSVMIFAGK